MPIPTQPEARDDQYGAAVLAALRRQPGVALAEAELLALAGASVTAPVLYYLIATINGSLARLAPGAGYIAHTPGSGYALVLPERAPAARLASLVGRDADVAAVAATLAARRFVSIVGPGGIGKTSVAQAVAGSCAAAFPDGCVTIDLAALADGPLQADFLAAALGMPAAAGPGSLASRLAAFLYGRRLLVVLDSAEHVIDAAGIAAEALLSAAPGVAVLATSREPLRAAGEHVHRLGPVALDAAVALFCARAFPGADLPPEDRDQVATLCGELDGLPLALELAAALAATLGLDGVAAQLGPRLLASGRRDGGGAARHRSLGAMLDWSYHMLAPAEQAVFRRLSVFRAGFTLAAAQAVAAQQGDDGDAVLEVVIGLIAKSLVSAPAGDGNGRLRLLDTTRAYAADKLCAAGEQAQLRARHAGWLCTLLDQAHIDWQAMPRAAWLARYSPWLDDVRAALDWAFGPGGDPMAGAALTASSFSLADQAGAVQEYAGRVEQALAALARMADPPPLLLMRLAGYARDSLRGPVGDLGGTMAALEDSLRAAAALGKPELQGAPLTALWGFPFTRGDYPASIAASERISAAARTLGDPVLGLIGQRTMAQSLHFMGRHQEASAAAHDALAGGWRRIPLVYAPSPVEIGTSMRILLARILWIQGLPADAALVCAEALRSAENDRPVALCQAIGLAAIPLALWNRDLAACEELLATLERHARRYSFGFWQGWTDSYRDVLAFMGDAGGGGATGFAVRASKHADHIATFDVRLLADEAIARVAGGKVGWCAPEVLRGRAERLIADGSAASGERLLRAALALAERQGALAWALRSGGSLAGVLLRQGDRQGASALLAPIVTRFRSGQSSADLHLAQGLLDQC